MKRNTTKSLVTAALCLTMGLLLPSVFHLLGAGSAFLPMHIPVLLCGLLCGWQYGALCGFITPLLSSLLTGMPPIFPVAPAMMLELCAYGALTGLFYRKARLPVYPALIGAMLAGRAVSGAANAVLLGMAGKPYGMGVFLTGAFVTALPGIAIQLVFVPLIVVALQRSGLYARPVRAEKAAAQ